MKNNSFFLFVILVLLSSACQRKTATLDEILGRPTTSKEQASEKENASVETPDTTTIANIPVPKIEEEPEPEKNEVLIQHNIPLSVVVARIKKTPCFGRCPVFEATVYASGRVVYEGKNFVEREGIHEATLTKSQLESLLAKAATVSYFSLASSYPTEGRNITDLPSTITYVKIGAQEKEITNNHDAPQALRDFEKAFVMVLEELEWTATPKGEK